MQKKTETVLEMNILRVIPSGIKMEKSTVGTATKVFLVVKVAVNPWLI